MLERPGSRMQLMAAVFAAMTACGGEEVVLDEIEAGRASLATQSELRDRQVIDITRANCLKEIQGRMDSIEAAKADPEEHAETDSIAKTLVDKLAAIDKGEEEDLANVPKIMQARVDVLKGKLNKRLDVLKSWKQEMLEADFRAADDDGETPIYRAIRDNGLYTTFSDTIQKPGGARPWNLEIEDGWLKPMLGVEDDWMVLVTDGTTDVLEFRVGDKSSPTGGSFHIDSAKDRLRDLREAQTALEEEAQRLAQLEADIDDVIADAEKHLKAVYAEAVADLPGKQGVIKGIKMKASQDRAAARKAAEASHDEAIVNMEGEEWQAHSTARIAHFALSKQLPEGTLLVRHSFTKGWEQVLDPAPDGDDGFHCWSQDSWTDFPDAEVYCDARVSPVLGFCEYSTAAFEIECHDGKPRNPVSVTSCGEEIVLKTNQLGNVSDSVYESRDISDDASIASSLSAEDLCRRVSEDGGEDSSWVVKLNVN